MFDQSCAQMLPSRCAGIGPFSGTDVAVLLAQLHPDVGVQLEIERPHLIPQPIELLRERVGRHVVLRAPHRAGIGEARAPSRPCSTAPRTARSPSSSAARSCASLPTPRAAPARCATSPARCVTSSMLWQASGFAGSGHHLPLPYTPRIRDTICVSSSDFFGSDGRRQHQRHLQQVELPPLVGAAARTLSNRDGLLGEPGDASDERLRGARVERFGVVGDEVLRHPSRLRTGHAQLQERRIHVGQKGLRVGGGRS